MTVTHKKLNPPRDVFYKPLTASARTDLYSIVVRTAAHDTR